MPSKERLPSQFTEDSNFSLQPVDLEGGSIIVGFPGEAMVDADRFAAAATMMERLLKDTDIPPAGYQTIFDVSESDPAQETLLANVRELRHLFFETAEGRRILESFYPAKQAREIWRYKIDILISFLENYYPGNRPRENMLEVAEGLEIRKALNTLELLFSDAEFLGLLSRRRLHLREKYKIRAGGVIVLSRDARRICNDLSLNFLLHTNGQSRYLAEGLIGRSLAGNGVEIAYSRDSRSYPRDRSSFLPGRRTAIMPINDDRLGSADIAEGGNVVDGQGNKGLSFIIVSEAVPKDEIERLMRYPECRGIDVLRLPSGFTRARLNGADIIIESNHIDTVIGFVPAAATKDGKNKLMVDPVYFAAARSGALENFLKRHGFTAEDGTLVMVDEEEADLMPCNMDFLKDGRVIINRAPRTIARLQIRDGAAIVPSMPVRNTAFFGAGLRCILGYNIPGLYTPHDLATEANEGDISHRTVQRINDILKVAGISMPAEEISAALATKPRPQRHENATCFSYCAAAV